jgi:hypothetical protein
VRSNFRVNKRVGGGHRAKEFCSAIDVRSNFRVNKRMGGHRAKKFLRSE